MKEAQIHSSLSLKLYIGALPEEVGSVRAAGFLPLYLQKIPDSALHRQYPYSAVSPPKGLLLAGTIPRKPEEIETFCRQLFLDVRSLEAEGYYIPGGESGAHETRFLDFMAHNYPYLPGYIKTIGKELPAGFTPVLSSAVTGGSFRDYIQEYTTAYRHPAMELELLQHDFALPCESFCGNALSKQAFDDLLSSLHPSCYYSQELCAAYFSYIDPDGGSHFVLYDDERTLTQKLNFAISAGITVYFGDLPMLTPHFKALSGIFRTDEAKPKQI